VAGLVATPNGIFLDRFGGQRVMAAGSLICGLGLMWLSQASNPMSYFGAWSVLGIAMSLTLLRPRSPRSTANFITRAGRRYRR